MNAPARRVVQDRLDGGWVADSPDVPGAVAQGDTAGEALDALDLVLADFAGLDTPNRRERAFCGNPRCPCADVSPVCPEYMDPNNRRLFENARGRCARCGNRGDTHPPMPEGAQPGWSLR